eukprot:2722771-Prymnesium_polylepis.1
MLGRHSWEGLNEAERAVCCSLASEKSHSRHGTTPPRNHCGMPDYMAQQQPARAAPPPQDPDVL